MSHTRIVLIEDDLRYRESLEIFFATSARYRVTAGFGSTEALVAQLQRLEAQSAASPWEIALVDLQLPQASGIVAIRALKQHYPTIAAIVVTVFEEPRTILDAIGAGADGYLLKKITGKDLIAQLDALDRDGAPLTPNVARVLLEFVRNEQLPSSEETPASRLALTPREQEVLRCLVAGMSYAQAGEKLSIGVETVRTHVRQVYRKLGVHSAAQAVSRAVRDRLV